MIWEIALAISLHTTEQSTLLLGELSKDGGAMTVELEVSTKQRRSAPEISPYYEWREARKTLLKCASESVGWSNSQIYLRIQDGGWAIVL